jgi:UDP-glucose 4-epimerase
VLAYGAAFGLPVLALRFFNVYGPLQRAGHPYAAVIPTFIDAALRHKPLVIHGDGRQVRDFTFVATVVQVLADAVAHRVTRAAPVNLAFGTRTSIAEVAGHIAAAAGVTPDIQYGPARAGDVPDSQADASLVREMFPRIQPVGLGMLAYRHDLRHAPELARRPPRRERLRHSPWETIISGSGRGNGFGAGGK